MPQTYLFNLQQNRYLQPILAKQGLLYGIFFKFLAVGLGFYTTYWINNYLAVPDQSRYHLITAYTPVILSLLSFGINGIIQKSYTNITDKQKLQDIWATFNFFRICTYFLGLLIVALTYRLANIENFLLVFLLFSAQFILIADQTYLSVCNSYNRNWQFTLVDFITKGLVAGFLVLAVFLNRSSGFNLYYLAVVLLFSYAFGMLLDAIWQRKDTRWGKIDLNLIKENRPVIISLTVTTMLTAVFLTTDRLVLERFASKEDFNGYSNAYKLFEIGIIVPSLITPAIASDFKRGLDKISDTASKIRYFLKYNFFIFLFGLVVSIGFVATSPLVLMLIQRKHHFESAYQSAPILGLALLTLFVSYFNKQVLIFIGEDKKVMYSVITTAIFSVMFYFLLIPSWRHYGAAIATVLGFSLDMGLKFWFLFRFLKKG